jgi:hypothetical protein
LRIDAGYLAQLLFMQLQKWEFRQDDVVRDASSVFLRCILRSSPCDICAVAYIPAWLREFIFARFRLFSARLFAPCPNTASSAGFVLENAIVLNAGDAS